MSSKLLDKFSNILEGSNGFIVQTLKKSAIFRVMSLLTFEVIIIVQQFL